MCQQTDQNSGVIPQHQLSIFLKSVCYLFGYITYSNGVSVGQENTGTSYKRKLIHKQGKKIKSIWKLQAPCDKEHLSLKSIYGTSQEMYAVDKLILAWIRVYWTRHGCSREDVRIRSPSPANILALSQDTEMEVSSEARSYIIHEMARYKAGTGLQADFAKEAPSAEWPNA